MRPLLRWSCFAKTFSPLFHLLPSFYPLSFLHKGPSLAPCPCAQAHPPFSSTFYPTLTAAFLSHSHRINSLTSRLHHVIFFSRPKGLRQTLLFTCSRLPKRETYIKQPTQITRSLIALIRRKHCHDRSAYICFELSALLHWLRLHRSNISTSLKHHV